MVINVFAIPLTDCCFFGVAMCCLAVMNSACSRWTVGKIVLSIVLVVIAICIRRIGVALIPPLLWMVFAQPEARRVVRHASIEVKIAGTFLIAGTLMAIAWVVYRTSTLQDAFKELSLNGADKLAHLPVWRLTELGEITANTPSVILSPAAMASLLPFIGIVTAFLVAGGVIVHRRHFGVVDVFFVSYVAGILEWPFYSPRFWMPVLPLLIAYSGLALKRFLRRDGRGTPLVFYAALVSTTAVGTLFALAGISLLAFSTTISLSGSRIGDLYHTGRYDVAYCAAGLCAHKPSDSMRLVDKSSEVNWLEEDGLRLLCEYRDGRLERGDR